MGEDQNTFCELPEEFLKLLLRSKQFRFKKRVRISNNVNCFMRKERKEKRKLYINGPRGITRSYRSIQKMPLSFYVVLKILARPMLERNFI